MNKKTNANIVTMCKVNPCVCFAFEGKGAKTRGNRE